MAIQMNWTDPRTGITLNQAFALVRDPLAREETRQVVVTFVVWGDRAAYDDGKEPIGTESRTLDSTVYDQLRPATLEVVEQPLCDLLGGNAHPIPEP